MFLKLAQRVIKLVEFLLKLGFLILSRSGGHSILNDLAPMLYKQTRVRPDATIITLGKGFVFQRMQHLMKLIILLYAKTVLRDGIRWGNQ